MLICYSGIKKSHATEEDGGQWIAEEGVGEPCDEAHWQGADFDLFECDLILLGMEHCAVWGSGWGCQCDEYHHTDAHADGHHWHFWIHILEGEGDWDDDGCHAGVVCEVCGDDREQKQDGDEDDWRFVTEEWGEHLNDELFQAGLLGSDGIADVNGGGNEEDDVPGYGAFCDGFEWEHWFSFEACDHEHDDAHGEYAVGAVGVEDLGEGPGFRHEAWCEEHDDEDQAGEQHDFLLNVHWWQWVFVELLWGDVFHLADVWTEYELDEEQEDDEQKQGHDKVVGDVRQIVDGDAGGFGECAGDDERCAFEWEHWLAESCGEINTKDGGPEDWILFIDAKFCHGFQHQWPEDQKRCNGEGEAGNEVGAEEYDE